MTTVVGPKSPVSRFFPDKFTATQHNFDNKRDKMVYFVLQSSFPVDKNRPHYKKIPRIFSTD